MYEPLGIGSTLDQGVILDDCPIVLLDDTANPIGEEYRSRVTTARVIVLTQACDLAQTKTTKALVAVLYEARFLVEQKILKAQTITDNIRKHQTFGWYFLPSGKDELAFPESIVDLRELHTIHRGILERLIAEGKGVCRLSTPYREHLAQHFGVTFMRIGLPEAYETEG